MRAIVGCLLMVSGTLLAAGQLLTADTSLWGAALLICAGVGLLLRRSPTTIDLRGYDGCRTCRGAGTVYSAEYNDWRSTGPIRVLRELCPSCEGLNP